MTLLIFKAKFYCPVDGRHFVTHVLVVLIYVYKSALIRVIVYFKAVLYKFNVHIYVHVNICLQPLYKHLDRAVCK